MPARAGGAPSHPCLIIAQKEKWGKVKNHILVDSTTKICDSILIFLQFLIFKTPIPSWNPSFLWLLWFQSRLVLFQTPWLARLHFLCRLLFLCSSFLSGVDPRPKSFILCTLSLGAFISSATKLKAVSICWQLPKPSLYRRSLSLAPRQSIAWIPTIVPANEIRVATGDFLGDQPSW